MRPPPTQASFDDDEEPNKYWIDWVQSELYPRAKRDEGTGTTAERPVNGIDVGHYYFDTDLGIPIWYNGSAWIDATGSTV